MQIKLDNIQKYYKVGKEKLHILKSLSLEIEEGEFIMIMGKSGSGKTTLLNVLGFLDKIDEGQYIFNDTDVSINLYCSLSMVAVYYTLLSIESQNNIV